MRSFLERVFGERVFCKDCKHAFKETDSTHVMNLRCKISFYTDDLVGGSVNYSLCSTARGQFGRCGRDGKYFELKDIGVVKTEPREPVLTKEQVFLIEDHLLGNGNQKIDFERLMNDLRRGGLLESYRAEGVQSVIVDFDKNVAYFNERDPNPAPKVSYTTPVRFSKTNQYGSGPDKEDDVYTVGEFLGHVKTQGFTDDDGWGYPVKDKKACTTICISPSTVHEIPSDATHIVWYNR